jgi:hypothetical protein
MKNENWWCPVGVWTCPFSWQILYWRILVRVTIKQAMVKNAT